MKAKEDGTRRRKIIVDDTGERERGCFRVDSRNKSREGDGEIMLRDTLRSFVYCSSWVLDIWRCTERGNRWFRLLGKHRLIAWNFLFVQGEENIWICHKTIDRRLYEVSHNRFPTFLSGPNSVCGSFAFYHAPCYVIFGCFVKHLKIKKMLIWSQSFECRWNRRVRVPEKERRGGTFKGIRFRVSISHGMCNFVDAPWFYRICRTLPVNPNPFVNFWYARHGSKVKEQPVSNANFLWNYSNTFLRSTIWWFYRFARLIRRALPLPL